MTTREKPVRNSVEAGRLLHQAQHAPTPEERQEARRALGLDPHGRSVPRLRSLEDQPVRAA